MSSGQQEATEKKLKRSDFETHWRYSEALAEDAIKKLEATRTLACLELAVARAKEFESKALPALKAALGDSVDWLPEIKSFCTQIDEEVTIIPSPLIHFASICSRSSFRIPDGGDYFWGEQKWCYCPINDFFVLMTEFKTFVVHPEDTAGLKMMSDTFATEHNRVPLSEYLARDKSKD